MDPTLPWMVRLRWAIAAGQLVLVGLVWAGIAPAWPLAPLLAVCAVGAASNLALQLAPEWSESAVGGVLLLDTVLLTALLWVTGGTSSPFSALYLVPVMLAAFTLRPALVWTAVAATGVEYLGLFAVGPAPSHHHGHAEMRAHIAGMFLAYAFSAPLLAAAVSRIREARDEATRQLASARALELRSQHLAALATLAAGASHELATPMSTILLAAREIERGAASEAAVEDARLIAEEVLRCKQVLEQMSVDSGAGMAEHEEPVTVRALVDDALSRGDRFDPVEVRLELPEQTRIRTAAGLVAQALRRLLGNARDAAGSGSVIALVARRAGPWLELSVIDSGSGMDAATLARAREPFFTTKAQGEGTGLGLYFTSSVVAHLRGELELRSAPGEGTTATLRLPLEDR